MRLAHIFLALCLTSCTTVAFGTSRTVFAQDPNVGAICETYESYGALSTAITRRSQEGWRVAQTGTLTTCFGFCSSSPIVCYERPASAGSVPGSMTTSGCSDDKSCPPGEACVFPSSGAGAKRCEPRPR